MNGFSNDNSFVNNNGVSTSGNISINASGVFTSSLSENSILATEIAKSNTRIETVDLDAIFFKTENEVSEEEVQKIMNDGSSDSATSQPDTKLRSNSTGSVGSYGDSSDSVDTSSILRSNSAGSAFTNGMGSNLEIIKKVPRQNVIDAQKKVEEKKSALAAAEKDLEDARKNPNITSQELQQKEINYDNAKKQYVQADDEFKNVIKNASESEAAAGGDSSSFLDSLKGAADAATDDILTQKASDAAANSGSGSTGGSQDTSALEDSLSAAKNAAGSDISNSGSGSSGGSSGGGYSGGSGGGSGSSSGGSGGSSGGSGGSSGGSGGNSTKYVTSDNSGVSGADNVASNSTGESWVLDQSGNWRHYDSSGVDITGLEEVMSKSTNQPTAIPNSSSYVGGN